MCMLSGLTYETFLDFFLAILGLTGHSYPTAAEEQYAVIFSRNNPVDSCLFTDKNQQDTLVNTTFSPWPITGCA